MRGPLVALSLLVTVAACSESGGPLDLVGNLSAPLEVDFGVVPIGLVGTATVPVSNSGGVPLRVTAIEAKTVLETDQFRFNVPLDGFTVGPFETVEVPVWFQPRATTRDPAGFTADVVMSTEVYDPEPPFANRSLQVTLRGRPTPPGIAVEPNPVNFGRVFEGGEKTVDVIVRNVADVPITVFGDTTDDGAVRFRPSDEGLFSIAPLPDATGQLDAALAPGGALRLRATFRPPPAPASRRAGWFLSSCSAPACRVLVEFVGEAVADLIVCAPDSVSFGRVNPGRSATREVVCTNVVSEPVTLTDAILEEGGAFTVRADLPQTLAPDDSTTLQVAYSPPTNTLGQTDFGTVRVVAEAAGAAQAVRVSVSGQAGGPRIEVEPNPLDFGLVAIGVPLTQGVLIRNTGFEALEVRELRLEGADASAFRIDPRSFALAAGEVRFLAVVFDPQREGSLRAALRVVSDDDQQPEVVVDLLGEAERVLPCQYQLTPSTVDFGTVFVGTQPVQRIAFTNTGPDACILNGIEIQADDPDTPFSLLEAPERGVRIEPGEQFSLRVRYRPTEPGTDSALVLARVSDPAGPVAGVPLFGQAEPPLNAGCPPPQTTPAGTPILLTAGTSDGVRYDWTLLSAPNGGNNTPNLWTPDPPRTRSVEFLPFIVGVYTIELDVQTTGGQTVSCQTQVTAEGQGLRVTLTWDGEGDIDLHVHDGEPGGVWFSARDCHYSNQTPIWVAGQPAGTGPNPELDFDNVRADGPENTSIDQPVINRTYHIGVHQFARAAGRRATIQVFCGGTSVPDASFTSRPLTGQDAGRCMSRNDFWRVGTVRFTNRGQCVISPIDTYTTAAEACTRL